MNKQNNICPDCHFHKSRHADFCGVTRLVKLFEQNSQERIFWDKGWIVGFNGDPKPDFPEDEYKTASSGWESGRQARIDLEK